MRRLLLDTHVALWWLTAHPRLGAAAQALIAEAECHLSAASVWEVAIKYKLGKLEIDPHALLNVARTAGFRILPVAAEHSAATAELPTLHGDPFDRLLIAQARLEHLHLLTADDRISQYGGDILLL
jgi:PIN domain nuclease of toxin-antitoxin system